MFRRSMIVAEFSPVWELRHDALFRREYGPVRFIIVGIIIIWIVLSFNWVR